MPARHGPAMIERLTITSLSILIIWCSSTVNAAEDTTYQSEFSYSKLSKTFNNTDTNIKSFTYRHHIEAIDPGGKPLQQAAFINRTGSYGLTYSSHDKHDLNGHETGYITALNYTHMQADSSLWFRFHHTTSRLSQLDYQPVVAPGVSTNASSSSLGFGYFLIDNGLIAFRHLESNRLHTTPVATGGYFYDESDVNQNTLLTKFVIPNKAGGGINLEISAGRKITRTYTIPSQESRSFELKADYYPDSRMSMGITYKRTKDVQTSFKGIETGISVNIYFKSGLFINHSYTNLEKDASNDKNDQFTAEIGFRF